MGSESKPLPKHLAKVLKTIVGNEGEDVRFLFDSHMAASTVSSYISKLKHRGLAYTHRDNGTTEVWMTKAGREMAQTIPELEEPE